jgi:hypothetical protein
VVRSAHRFVRLTGIPNVGPGRERKGQTSNRGRYGESSGQRGMHSVRVSCHGRSPKKGPRIRLDARQGSTALAFDARSRPTGRHGHELVTGWPRSAQAHDSTWQIYSGPDSTWAPFCACTGCSEVHSRTN